MYRRHLPAKHLITLVGLLLIGLIFRVIKGVIRLVLIVGVLAFLAYIVLNYAR